MPILKGSNGYRGGNTPLVVETDACFGIESESRNSKGNGDMPDPTCVNGNGGYVPMIVVDDNSDRKEISGIPQGRHSGDIEKS